MIQYTAYLKNFLANFPELEKDLPWNIVAAVQNTIQQKIKSLSADFKIKQDVAIHKKAQIEENVTLKGPIIVSNGCFIGAHAYMRGGVYLGEKSIVGPGCEAKVKFDYVGKCISTF